jgi:ABC-2 type transport system permease protein
VPGGIASILEYLSIDYHFSNIARGVIDTRDIIYYFSAMSLMLYLSTVVLSKRRWS